MSLAWDADAERVVDRVLRGRRWPTSRRTDEDVEPTPTSRGGRRPARRDHRRCGARLREARRCAWSRRAGRRARSAAARSTRKVTSAPAPTATAAEDDARRSTTPGAAGVETPTRSSCCAAARSRCRAGSSTPSNATLFAHHPRRRERWCVYKPVAGERPLWDFPDGTLAGREVAAYLLSEARGWGVVPPTVLRDGPFGPGHGAAVDRRRTDGTELGRRSSPRRRTCPAAGSPC